MKKHLDTFAGRQPGHNAVASIGNVDEGLRCVGYGRDGYRSRLLRAVYHCEKDERGGGGIEEAVLKSKQLPGKQSECQSRRIRGKKVQLEFWRDKSKAAPSSGVPGLAQGLMPHYDMTWPGTIPPAPAVGLLP